MRKASETAILISQFSFRVAELLVLDRDWPGQPHLRLQIAELGGGLADGR